MMRSAMKTTFTVLGLTLAAVACGGGLPTPPSVPGAPGVPGTPAAGAEPKTFDEQVAAGKKLYADNCASCHGDNGEGGGKTPPVVGVAKGALPLDAPATSKTRKGTQFKTAADIGLWAAKNMPPGGGGSLKESEYWSILAFDLKANGVSSDKKLDATSAKEIVIHK